MFRAVWLILIVCATGWGCAPRLLTHDAFADAFIEEVRTQAPDMKVRKAGSLHVTLEGPKGEEVQAFLDNAYKRYRTSPDALPTIIEEHTRSILEARAIDSLGIDSTKIVPVIKHRTFLRDLLQAAQGRNGADPPDTLAREPFVGDLVVLYAADSEANIRYLTDTQLSGSGFPTATRRALAVTNLKVLLPKIEAHGGEGTYLLYAGGVYEASLLLFDDIWRSGHLQVKGDLVVAVPARNVLVITGSRDPEGLAAMGRIISEATIKEAYTISDQRFVYRGGRFVLFGG